jgi:hypothetical protein
MRIKKFHRSINLPAFAHDESPKRERVPLTTTAFTPSVKQCGEEYVEFDLNSSSFQTAISAKLPFARTPRERIENLAAGTDVIRATASSQETPILRKRR